MQQIAVPAVAWMLQSHCVQNQGKWKALDGGAACNISGRTTVALPAVSEVCCDCDIPKAQHNRRLSRPLIGLGDHQGTFHMCQRLMVTKDPPTPLSIIDALQQQTPTLLAAKTLCWF